MWSVSLILFHSHILLYTDTYTLTCTHTYMWYIQIHTRLHIHTYIHEICLLNSPPLSHSLSHTCSNLFRASIRRHPRAPVFFFMFNPHPPHTHTQRHVQCDVYGVRALRQCKRSLFVEKNNKQHDHHRSIMCAMYRSNAVATPLCQVHVSVWQWERNWCLLVLIQPLEY